MKIFFEECVSFFQFHHIKNTIVIDVILLKLLWNILNFTSIVRYVLSRWITDMIFLQFIGEPDLINSRINYGLFA